MTGDDLPVALATLALVPAIYGTALPPLAVVRGVEDDHGHVRAGIAQAATLAALMVGAVVAVTGSPTVAVIGGVAVVAYACLYANARDVTP